MMRTSALLLFVVFATGLFQQPDPVNPDPESPRPIAAEDTVFLEAMTWMEIRDAIRHRCGTASIRGSSSGELRDRAGV